MGDYDTMTNEHEFGECESCGEHAKLQWGGLVVGGRDYGECRICDDCAITGAEYRTLTRDVDRDERVHIYYDV